MSSLLKHLMITDYLTIEEVDRFLQNATRLQHFNTGAEEFVNAWLGQPLDAVDFKYRDLKEKGGCDYVPFDFRGHICHTFGKKYSPTLQIAGGNIQFDLKIPKRVHEKMKYDIDFADKMAAYLYAVEKTNLLKGLTEQGYDVCMSCATKKAVGFVMSCSNDIKPNRYSLTLLIGYPVCGDIACNSKLHKLRKKFVKNVMPSSSVQNRCTFCKKYGDRTTNKVLLRCTGCKKVYYCSKECQAKDWQSHKPKCKMFRESKK